MAAAAAAATQASGFQLSNPGGNQLMSISCQEPTTARTVLSERFDATVGLVDNTGGKYDCLYDFLPNFRVALKSRKLKSSASFAGGTQENVGHGLDALFIKKNAAEEVVMVEDHSYKEHVPNYNIGNLNR